MKKNKTRRQFIITGLKAGAILPVFGSSLVSCLTKSDQSDSAEAKTDQKLNILILGGTSFLGPHQVAYAISRGHSITTFTRGKTKPTVHNELFADVEQLIGDRADNLDALRDRKWDAVIDNSGHKSEWTSATAVLLKDNVDLYLYTSSTGVYYPYLGSDIKENTNLVMEVPDGIESEDEKMEYGYGVMKSNSEIEAKRAFGDDRTIIVRPTYMVGPADKLDRFIHWPVRLSQGGEIMVPGKSDDPVQYIDVRDVASWMIRLIENKSAGTFNAVGPAKSIGIHDFVKEAHSAFDSEASFINIDDYDFLKEHHVPYLVPWIMPDGNNIGSALVNNKQALANGLMFTPLTQTMIDTHHWWYNEDSITEHRQKFESNPNTVLSREKDIISSWKARR